MIIIINNRINIQTDYNLRCIPTGILNNNKIVTEGDISLYEIQLIILNLSLIIILKKYL